MKQTRRKELKTNELIIYLQQIRDSAARNSNYIIGGLVVVVLVLIIGLSIQRSRAKTESDRWSEYRAIQTAANEGKTDVIDRAAALAEQTSGDARLGPRAMTLHADLLREKAMSISPTAQSPERDQLLEKARDAYQRLIDAHAGKNKADAVTQARMKLAAVAEDLYVDGKGDLGLARQQYEAIIKDPNNPFRNDAQRQLDTLAERTKPLKIVATRPAESEPAPAKNTATAPAGTGATPQGAAAPVRPAPAAATKPAPSNTPAARP